MKKILKQTFPAIAVATLLMAQSAYAETIFSDGFSKPSADSPIDTIGWTGYQEATAEAIWSTGAGTKPDDGVWLPRLSGANGNLYANGVDPILLYTEAGPFGSSGAQYTFGQIEDIHVNLNNGLGREVNIAIRVGSNWYASTDTFYNTSGYETHTLDITTASWYGLTVAPGTELSIGSTAVSITDSELVTAVGIFSTDSENKNQVRLGSYQVTAIPEPATMSLLLGGVIGASCILRRRRS